MNLVTIAMDRFTFSIILALLMHAVPKSLCIHFLLLEFFHTIAVKISQCFGSSAEAILLRKHAVTMSYLGPFSVECFHWVCGH